ncbi:MAG TPA: DUF72 domain-containing protein [Pseudomonadales bacterium]
MARLHIGLPMWNHPQWHGRFFAADTRPADCLKHYASVFNSVEGNTSFYAIPSEASLLHWRQSVPADFRFCFKLPKSITHDLKLQRCDAIVDGFFQRIQLLREQLGPLIIQLPATFDSNGLPVLAQFLKTLPAMFRYVVEVRHADFFAGGEPQRQLEQLLARYRIDRLCFDTRALFDSHDGSEATRDAQRKKPQLPLINIREARTPVLRFIGHSNMAASSDYFADWVEQVAGWLQAGREPYLFFHMADNGDAPELAALLWRQLQQRLPQLPDFPDWPAARHGDDGQISLF